MRLQERIRIARESLEEAGVLSHENIGNKAVLSKLYHAMMQSLMALLGMHDIGRKTHADVIEQFEREYVAVGKIEAATLAVIRRAYDLTHECDCDHMPVPTESEITAAQRTAAALLWNAEEQLQGGEK